MEGVQAQKNTPPAHQRWLRAQGRNGVRWRDAGSPKTAGCREHNAPEIPISFNSTKHC